MTLVVANKLDLPDAEANLAEFARARERASVLVAIGPWPVEASIRLYAEGGPWSGLDEGSGALGARDLHVRVEAKGVPTRGQLRALAG